MYFQTSENVFLFKCIHINKVDLHVTKLISNKFIHNLSIEKLHEDTYKL